MALLSCQPEPTINFAEALQGCLTSKDITLINKATAQFESKLNDTYGAENSNKNYITYLEDFSKMNLNPKFTIDSNSKTILDDLKASGTFNKIWISVSKLNNFKERQSEDKIIEIEPQNKTVDLPKIDIITINPKGLFYTCLLKSTGHKSLNEAVAIQTKGPSLSFGLISKAVANSMTEKDLNNSLNKVTIAIIFYYEMIHLTNQNL
jgi:hypothetical protein